MFEIISIVFIIIFLFIIGMAFLEILTPFILIGIFITSILYLVKIYIFDLYINSFISILIIVGIIGIFLFSINFVIKIFFYNIHFKIKKYFFDIIDKFKTQIKIEQKKQNLKGVTKMNVLTVTEIGKIFDKSSREINEAFCELNWILKDNRGWKATEQGIQNGAVQTNFKGTLSVRWKEDIKNNELLKNIFKPKIKPAQKTSYKEKIEKGKDYEIFIGKYFEEKGYIVKFNGIENGVKDNSVDIIAIKKDEIIFIQCKNWKVESKYKITHKDIKAFLGDIYILIIENERYQGYNEKRLFVASNEIFDNSAKNYCKEHKNIIDYMCLPMI